MSKGTKLIYADNAATTMVDPRVQEEMRPYWERCYGNASMGYRLGSRSKVALEGARKKISALLYGEEGDFFFTSGGTEGNNWAIKGAVVANGIQHIITSQLEHTSILAPIRYLVDQGAVSVHYVALDGDGYIDYKSLARLLAGLPKVLVTLMHGNNEVGNLTDIDRVGRLCRRYGALLHSDMVQTAGYYPLHLTTLPIDLITMSAHKFYGPKGVGLLYVRRGVAIAPLHHGGGQERGLRAGTENVAGIVGMARALELAVLEREEIMSRLYRLKRHFIEGLQRGGPGVIFHGGGLNMARSMPHIINVGFPWKGYRDTLLMHFDIAGIALSSGSACMSGHQVHSHVLEALGVSGEYPVVRFSFGKYNRLEEVDRILAVVKSIERDSVANSRALAGSQDQLVK